MKAKTLYLPWAALAMVLPANADIIYSNFQNITIPATFDGLYLDVDGGNGWNTDMASPVTGWDINFFYGGRSATNSPAFQPVRSGTGSSSPIVNLAAGESIGTGSVFSTFVQGAGGETPGAPGYGGSSMLTGSGGNFTANTEGYLGFRLNDTQYGWMRAVFTNNTAGAVVKDWAYDTTTGTTIKAGLIQTHVTSGLLTTTTLNPGISDSYTLASALTNGVVSGGYTNSVLKLGDGTVTLTAASTYTGDTSVAAGSLQVNNTTGSGTGSGSVSVSATLGGAGIIAGAVNVSTSGTISPGAGGGVGNLTLQNGLTLGGIYQWQLGALSTANAGFDYDTLTLTVGDVNLTGSSLGLNLGDFQPSLNEFWQSDRTWSGILNHTGSGTLTGNFAAIDNSSWSSLGTFSTTYTGNDVNLVWTAVPEPDPALLVAGLGMVTLLRRRRL
jgi:autotransporter-associated beta strand protein